MMKIARARENRSLHRKEGLKQVAMATPRSFVVSAITTGVTSVKMKEVVAGCPIGMWQHLLTSRRKQSRFPQASDFHENLRGALQWLYDCDLLLDKGNRERIPINGLPPSLLNVVDGTEIISLTFTKDFRLTVT